MEDLAQYLALKNITSNINNRVVSIPISIGGDRSSKLNIYADKNAFLFIIPDICRFNFIEGQSLTDSDIKELVAQVIDVIDRAEAEIVSYKLAGSVEYDIVATEAVTSYQSLFFLLYKFLGKKSSLGLVSIARGDKQNTE